MAMTRVMTVIMLILMTVMALMMTMILLILWWCWVLAVVVAVVQWWRWWTWWYLLTMSTAFFLSFFLSFCLSLSLSLSQLCLLLLLPPLASFRWCSCCCFKFCRLLLQLVFLLLPVDFGCVFEYFLAQVKVVSFWAWFENQ